MNIPFWFPLSYLMQATSGVLVEVAERLRK
jgi:hypothetical protein